MARVENLYHSNHQMLNSRLTIPLPLILCPGVLDVRHLSAHHWLSPVPLGWDSCFLRHLVHFSMDCYLNIRRDGCGCLGSIRTSWYTDYYWHLSELHSLDNKPYVPFGVSFLERNLGWDRGSLFIPSWHYNSLFLE